MYVENIPKKIKFARRKWGFTQEEVSRETKIPRETISRYESGIRQPSIEHLATLADFYQVSIDWLIGTSKENYQIRPKKIKKITLKTDHPKRP